MRFIIEEYASYGIDINKNFEKFIVGKNGRVTARITPHVKPLSVEVTAAIEKELSR